MSGKYQHFLPRFLQDGFRANAKGKKTYWYHKVRGVRLTSIGEIGAENYFYSRPSDNSELTLDDIITKEETILTTQMDDLRELPIGARVDANMASEMIAHFSVRTRNFREFFGTAGDILVQEMSDAVSDIGNMARLLGLDQPIPNDLWRDFFEKRSDGNQIIEMVVQETEAPRGWVERIIFVASREIIFSKYNENIGGLAGSLVVMRSMLKKGLAGFHNSALLESRKTQKRIDALASLHWQICAAPTEGAILPDCVVLGRGSNDQNFSSYIMTSGNEFDVVVMPISTRRMLVGVQKGATPPSMVNFNKEAAANSAEFFVAAQKTDATEALMGMIGSEWLGRIDDLIDHSIGEYRAIPGPTPVLMAHLIDDDRRSGSDETTDAVDEITKLVKLYQEACPKTFNLDALETLTFAEDPNAVLAEIDLGPSPEHRAETCLLEIVPGVALVNVRRDDNLKIIVLSNASFYRALTSNETNQKELARSALLLSFAQVSAIARIEKSLSGYMLEPVSYSDHDALVHCAVRSSIRAYWAGRDIPMISKVDTLIREMTDFAVRILASSVKGIDDTKKNYLETEESGPLFISLVAEVSKFLAQLARIIGLQHGCGTVDEEVLPSALSEGLRPYELETWALIYGRDLRSIWEKEQLALSDLYPMNIHVERFLLSFGILVWRDEMDGETRCRPFDA